MERKIPIVICVDVEPDERQIKLSKSDPWYGYEKAYRALNHFRRQVIQSTGSQVHFLWCYRLDPQVEAIYNTPLYPFVHYPEYIDHLVEENDEIGIHPHPIRWDSTRKEWINDRNDQAWVNKCIQMCSDQYKKHFSRQCQTIRFGDAWMNQATMNFIEELGFYYDLTLEPDHPACLPAELKNLGFNPHYQGVPRYPYQPKGQNFRVPRSSLSGRMWTIPVSMETTYGNQFCTIHRNVEIDRIRIAGCTECFKNNFEYTLNNNNPYFVFTVRSDVFLSEEKSNNIEKNLKYIVQHSLVNKFVYCKPSELVSILGLEIPQSIHS